MINTYVYTYNIQHTTYIDALIEYNDLDALYDLVYNQASRNKLNSELLIKIINKENHKINMAISHFIDDFAHIHRRDIAVSLISIKDIFTRELIQSDLCISGEQADDIRHRKGDLSVLDQWNYIEGRGFLRYQAD